MASVPFGARLYKAGDESEDCWHGYPSDGEMCPLCARWIREDRVRRRPNQGLVYVAERLGTSASATLEHLSISDFL
jgi:hypothetical protein